jgi:NAD(P)-dependent dehydrogenase (short-subunit alcohol dehydrogenase family)
VSDSGRPRVALVTGAGSGIGQSTALAFARQGLKVVASDVSFESVEETARLIRENGVEALAVQASVSDAQQAEYMVKEALRAFGALDVAFNNAGVRGPDADTASYSEEDWRRVLDVNLTGTWLSMKYELAVMLEQGSGVIVNNASTAGTRGLKNASAYAASKHAVLGLTKTAALEYATKGIRINAVCPGYVDTPLLYTNGVRRDSLGLAGLVRSQPMRRLATQEEVANAVLFLASDAASFITGHALAVDGGITAG